MKTKLTLLIIIICIAISASTQSLLSPDGNLRIDLSLQKENGENALFYAVQYKDKPVILTSRLGITCWEGEHSFQISEVKEIARSQRDTAWVPLYGERNHIRDRFNQMEINLKDSIHPKHLLHLLVRAYNEGIAFRYVMPEFPSYGDYLHITSEETSFQLPEGTMAWFTPRAQAKYQRLPLSGWPGECERPLTLELPNGLYACLAEAEVVNYARTKFVVNNRQKNAILCSMYGEVDEVAPFYSPWRVVMVAEKPGDLLQNNDLILNLNPPSNLENTWWIKPGKVMRSSLTTTDAKQLVDFAVKRHLQYIHLDAGWYGHEYTAASDATSVPLSNKEKLDIAEIVAYAKKYNIGVFLYVNQRALEKQLDEILPLYRDWGISGVKFGFVQVGSHRWTNWMHEAVKKCAKYQLMVDIHDEYRPTGFSRTYPNLLTQEGIYGNEEMPDATLNTTVPFTRFVAGAADYTICYYRQRSINPNPKLTMIKTTSGHQLALSVVYYSPLQFMYWYDSPKDSHDEPELEFFDRVPTVWDDTKVLQGEIGQYIAVARRSGCDWFLGAITGVKGRTMKLSLDFLEPDKTYLANIYSDGDNEIKTATKVKITRCLVNHATVLTSLLKDSGGEAIYLTPATFSDKKEFKPYRNEKN